MTEPIPRSLDDIPGWFSPLDQLLFDLLLRRQEDTEPPGDLLELGCYLGKSAVLIGEHLRPGEQFIVCDLFGDEAPAAANAEETAEFYAGLTRPAFERNYLAFHAELPTVLQMPTDRIGAHVAAGSCRFVHVDASHLYPHVAADVRSAQALLRPGGLVAFDDYRTMRTPGVGAAVWEAMFTLGLRPIVLTPRKWYGTWGETGPTIDYLRAQLRTRRRWQADDEEVAGHRLLRVAPPVEQS